MHAWYRTFVEMKRRVGLNIARPNYHLPLVNLHVFVSKVLESDFAQKNILQTKAITLKDI